MGYNIQYIYNMNIIYIIETFLSIFDKNIYKNFTNFKIPDTQYPDLEPGLYYKHKSSCDEVRINILYNKYNENIETLMV